MCRIERKTRLWWTPPLWNENTSFFLRFLTHLFFYKICFIQQKLCTASFYKKKLQLFETNVEQLIIISDVCTKYQEAAKIVNLALQGLVSQCVPGAKIIDLCEFGHTVMEAQASKLYTKKVDGKLIDRGVSFPVCISVNDVVCNHSPIPTEERVSFFVLVGRLVGCICSRYTRKILLFCVFEGSFGVS